MLKKLGILLLGPVAAWAATGQDEVQAARLDQDLTAGSGAGRQRRWQHPALTGGITQAPVGYRPGMHHLDPFAADRPRLVVDSRNMAAYQALLTPGTQALLQANPDYHLRVFLPPQRIPAAAPVRRYPRQRQPRRADRRRQRRAGAAAIVPFPCRRAARKRSGTTSCATAASNCTCRPTRRRCWPATAATTCSSSTATCTSSAGREG